MNLVFFASVATLSIAIAVNIRKNKKDQAAIEQDFWAREREANSTRRKSLDDLDYIRLPMETFPMTLLEDVPKVEDYKQIILTLKDLPIVNFTGISNTELKLRYGAPNIDLLTQYDQNYTLLVRTLQQWAQLLYDAGCWSLPYPPAQTSAAPTVCCAGSIRSSIPRRRSAASTR